MEDKKQSIELTISGIIKVVFVILVLIFIYAVRDIFFIFVAALIIAAALDAPISWLQKKKVPRILGTFLIYVFIFFILAGLLYLLLPPLAGEIKSLGNSLPEYLDRISSFQKTYPTLSRESVGLILNGQDILLQIANNLTRSASSVFSTTINIFGGFVSVFIILVIAIYFNSRGGQLDDFVLSLTPEKHKNLALNVMKQTRNKMSRWLWGRFLMSVFVFLAIFLGLSILGVKYALLLGILAGILDVVPYIGPVISAVPAIISALLSSVLMALGVVVLYVLVNQIFESFIVQPLVMKKAVGVNPVVILLAVLVGGKLAGLLGIIFAIPVVAILNVFVTEYIKEKKLRSA